MKRQNRIIRKEHKEAFVLGFSYVLIGFGMYPMVMDSKIMHKIWSAITHGVSCLMPMFC